MVAMNGRGREHPYFALPSPWLIAHRGGSLEAPENTLVAFEHAAALGADVIETDVHLSADGEVMVFHDDDTRRLTGVPGTVEARTKEELATLDAAFGFSPNGQDFPWRGKGVRIPTLVEVLARFPRMRFNIEAKGDEAPLAEALAQVLEAAGREQTVCVGAAHRVQARRLKDRLPRYARFLPTANAFPHFLAAWRLLPRGWTSGDYDLAAVPIRQWGVGVISKCVVDHFHARGMPIQVWTVDEERDMRLLLRRGVDGIMSDRPSLLKRVMGR
jgi:glycerophosphoryl diester phosphodiesterase